MGVEAMRRRAMLAGRELPPPWGSLWESALQSCVSLNPHGNPRRLVLGWSPLYRERKLRLGEGKDLAQDLTGRSWQVLDLRVSPPSAC